MCCSTCECWPGCSQQQAGLLWCSELHFLLGDCRGKGLRDWGGSRRGLLNYKPSIFTLLRIQGSKWCWWGIGDQFGVSEHLLSPSVPELAIAKHLMGGDDTDKGVHIYAGYRRWEKESLCRKCNVIWRNTSLDHSSWPFHCRSVFNIPSSWNPLVNFYLYFFLLPPPPTFFFLSFLEGARWWENEALAMFVVVLWPKLKNGPCCQGASSWAAG